MYGHHAPFPIYKWYVCAFSFTYRLTSTATRITSSPESTLRSFPRPAYQIARKSPHFQTDCGSFGNISLLQNLMQSTYNFVAWLHYDFRSNIYRRSNSGNSWLLCFLGLAQTR